MFKLFFKNIEFNLLFSVCCNFLAAISFGYAIGYSSPAVPDLITRGKLDKSSSSLFVSLVTLGAVIGCLFGGWSIDKKGRKLSLIYTSVPYFLGWCLISRGSTHNMLYVGRLLTAIGTGITMVVCPTYLSEISPAQYRGMFGSSFQLGITFGIFVVYAFGIFLNAQKLAFIGSILPLICVLMSFYTFETPRYLIINGLKQKAFESLAWFRSKNADVNDELRDIEESIDTSQISWSEFKKFEYFRPLVISVSLMMFQQFSGINIIMFYTVNIFQSAGFGEQASTSTMIIGLVQVFGTLFACYTIDSYGRRTLLFLSGAGMSISLGFLGLYYFMASSKILGFGWLALASLICFIASFSLGWGPIPMLAMSELFPAKAKGRASAIVTISNSTFAFLVTNQYETLLSFLDMHGTFWIFSLVSLFSIIFVKKMLPETKGKSLEDIELFFLGQSSMRTTV